MKCDDCGLCVAEVAHIDRFGTDARVIHKSEREEGLSPSSLDIVWGWLEELTPD